MNHDDDSDTPDTIPPEPAAAARVLQASYGDGGMTGGRVLVVEPDPDLQWSIARTLTVRGHRVVGATSGEAALHLVSQWPVEVALVDATLPGTSALELAEALRRAQPEVRVVLMARDLAPDMRLRAHVAGVVACVVKPFRLEHLSELLDQLTTGLLDTIPRPALPAE